MPYQVLNTKEHTPEPGQQCLLLGSREMSHVIGYFNDEDGQWYINTDREDYQLTHPPLHFVVLKTCINDIADKGAEPEKEEYQFVKLKNGKYQIACKCDYKFFKAQWHIDVFGEEVIIPEEVYGPLNWTFDQYANITR